MVLKSADFFFKICIYQDVDVDLIIPRVHSIKVKCLTTNFYLFFIMQENNTTLIINNPE